MTDIAKVREMSDRELEDALKQAKQELWSARFALSTRQLNDTSSIPRTRRERTPARPRRRVPMPRKRAVRPRKPGLTPRGVPRGRARARDPGTDPPEGGRQHGCPDD